MSFSVLTPIPTSPGVTRAFNNFGELVWLARFRGGSQGIVRTVMP
jgi:hypothetical protein